MHWKHSRFEIAYIIMGNCHTFDEAYRILCELEEDRQFSIESSLAESLRAQSKVVTAKVILNDKNESKSGKLNAECNIAEQKARSKIAQPCLDEARRELLFIRMLKDIVNEKRQFKEHPDYVAHQLAQSTEWKFDLHWKSYNHLASTGYIPYDHMMQLKMHPESESLIEGVMQLRQFIQNDTEAFLMLSKESVLEQVARGAEKPHLLTKTHFTENQVLSELQLELDDIELDQIEFGGDSESEEKSDEV